MMQFLRRATWVSRHHVNFALKTKDNSDVFIRFTRIYCTDGGSDIKIQTTLQKQYTTKRDQIKHQLQEDGEKFLANLSETDQKKLKLFKFEHELWYSQGDHVPETLEDWQYAWLLQDCPTYGKRLRQLRVWARREYNKVKKKAKKEDVVEVVGTGHDICGKMSYKWPKSNDERMNRAYYHRIAQSAQFGPHLIWDLGVAEGADGRQLSCIAKQVQLAHGYNKIQAEPFNFTFTSCKAVGGLQRLESSFQNIQLIPYTSTDSHYLDLFPKDQLVYLSPNARTEMEEYDPNKIYIIGCIVDIQNERPITYGKARQEHIQSMKFPLDKYLLWQSGSKALTLDCVLKIMHGLKSGQDWRTVLNNNVPKRHLEIPAKVRRRLQMAQQQQ